jgi:hypothetical protein
MNTINLSQQVESQRSAASEEKVIASVADAIARLRFGSIALTIHDGKVVQLDVTERKRFG